MDIGYFIFIGAHEGRKQKLRNHASAPLEVLLRTPRSLSTSADITLKESTVILSLWPTRSTHKSPTAPPPLSATIPATCPKTPLAEHGSSTDSHSTENFGAADQNSLSTETVLMIPHRNLRETSLRRSFAGTFFVQELVTVQKPYLDKSPTGPLQTIHRNPPHCQTKENRKNRGNCNGDQKVLLSGL